MYCDCGVTQHRLWSRRGNDNHLVYEDLTDENRAL